jgi:hypothetical protein
MKKLLRTLTHWKLPPAPWKWSSPDGVKNELHMGVFVIQDPKKNNELVKVHGGVLFHGNIEFVNVREEVMPQFMEIVENLPDFRTAFMEMRGQIIVAAQLLKEAANDTLSAEWHRSVQGLTRSAEILAFSPDEQREPPLIVMQ